MVKLKVPKLTREQKKSCKLSQKQIDQVPQLRSEGLTQKEIAEMFNVSPATIGYWCLSEEKRKERILQVSQSTYKQDPEEAKKAVKRRKEILKEQWSEYYKKYSKKWRKEHPKEYKKWIKIYKAQPAQKKKARDYYKNNAEEKKKKSNDYYYLNRDTILKKSREKNARIKRENQDKGSLS